MNEFQSFEASNGSHRLVLPYMEILGNFHLKFKTFFRLNSGSDAAEESKNNNEGKME